MSDAVTIRSVVPADLEQWRPLWDGYNRFYGRAGATALPEKTTKTTWARFFDPNEPIHALVAEKNEKLLGLVHYLFHRSTILLEPRCYLQDLFTHETARGQGIGRALIEAVYERAESAGSPQVYWQTHETNTTAMKLYDSIAERSGFIVYRRRV